MYIKIKLLKSYIFFIMIFCKINADNESWLTIFIHGIVRPPISIGDLYKISQDNIDNTDYIYTVEYLRNSPQLATSQAMQELGLSRIDGQNKIPGNASGSLAELFEYQLGNPNNAYYTFGWSGLLTNSERVKNAQYLIEDIKNALINFNQMPKIRLVGYSHGGNIILNMAKFISDNNLPFTIDETIFIATPVQKENDYLINHPVFKKIYNFYSTADVAQRADKFTTRYFFSHQKFGRQCLDLPDKLTQIQIRVTKSIYNLCNCIKRKFHVDPQHSEMWIFGWTPKSYRAKFPLYPLPVVSLVPTIINNINCIQNLSNDLTIDLKPVEELMSITDNLNKLKHDIPTPNLFSELINISLEYEYLDYTRSDNKKLVKDAMLNAILEKKNYCKNLKLKKRGICNEN